MYGNESEYYIASMNKDIAQLVNHKTWERVNYNGIPPGPDGNPHRVIKGTWTFKLKRLPDNTPLKYKSYYCVRGDIQKSGVEYFENYDP